jgi:hypothetical protein
VVADGVVSCVRPPTPGHNFALLSAPPTTLVLDVSNPAAPESICRLSVDGAHFVSASELVFMGVVKGNPMEGRIDLNNQTATVSFTLATRGDSLVPAPAWTRNGDVLAYAATGPGPSGGALLTVHLVTHGADRVIVSYPEELGHGGPNQGPVRSISFSADGRYLVLFNMFSRGTGQAAPFQIRGLAGELVYALDTSALFPLWSGSGSQLYFRKGQCCVDQGDLMSWEAATSVKTVVPNLAWYAPAQSPDGRWIAYTTAYGPSYLPHIGLFSPASGDARRVSEKPRSFPAFVSSNALWFGEEAPVANGMFPSEPTGKFLAYNLDSGQESAISLPTGAVPTGFSLNVTDVWPRPGS